MSNDGHLKSCVATIRSRVDAARAAVEARRPHFRSVDATLAAMERDRERAGWLLAGATYGALGVAAALLVSLFLIGRLSWPV